MINTPDPRDARRIAALAVLVVTGVLGTLLLRPHTDTTLEVEAATDLAEQHVDGLVSLSARDTATALERLTSQATGEWAQQLAADPAGMAKALRAGGVSAEGHVDSSAVAAGSSESPRVLVAASSLVSNRSGAKKTTRTYYFVVTTRQVGDVWKIAAVEAAQ